MAQIRFETPTGTVAVRETDGAITEIGWVDDWKRGWARDEAPDDETPLLAEARRQILAYFDGRRRTFDLPLSPHGPAFQQAVWKAMLAIPFGAVRTYGDLARDLDSVPRAVGTACGRNPLPIVIPCHRVVGGNGRLTGFSGGNGIETKRALLRLEGAMLI